jgi:hypothetical protein
MNSFVYRVSSDMQARRRTIATSITSDNLQKHRLAVAAIVLLPDIFAGLPERKQAGLKLLIAYAYQIRVSGATERDASFTTDEKDRMQEIEITAARSRWGCTGSPTLL